MLVQGPESLEKGRYSEKSDVWAFGVLCWELLTCGAIPYTAITNDDEVVVRKQCPVVACVCPPRS